MAGRYKAYSEHQESGVEWLGEIPKNWKVKRLKHLCRVKTGAKDTQDSIEFGEYPFFVRSQTVERISSYSADCEAILTAGDGVGVGKVFHHYKGKFDYHQRVYMLSSFHGITGRFLFYYLSNNFHKVALDGNAKSTVDSLRLPQFLNFEFSLPSLSEQKQIARFLDHETGKIDLLIEKQHALIALLKEKRQAVISHAVTKGLNPEARMKDSGVEWLDEVPEHWEVKRLKHIVTNPLMYGANEAALDIDPRQPRFVRITDVATDGSLRDETFRSLKDELAEPYLLSSGDVLLARSGGTVGKSFIYSDTWGQCCFAGYLIKASLDKRTVLADWFYQYTKTLYYWEWIGSNQIQSTIQNVSADKYNGFLLAVPPVSEQSEIIRYLNGYTDTADDLIAKAEYAIELMQERRTALISAAVTGKIDVRDWEPAPEA